MRTALPNPEVFPAGNISRQFSGKELKRATFYLSLERIKSRYTSATIISLVLRSNGFQLESQEVALSIKSTIANQQV